jgi:GT2 family glycosyltransferase
MIKLASDSVAHHGKAHLGNDVTVAVAAYGNYQATVSTLQSLFLAASGDFELLLVDNASPDAQVSELLQQARREHENTSLFVFKENREYTGALNCILSHAKGKWIFFLSNDIFVTPYYLREIMAAAHANELHGIIRGTSNFVDNGKASHNINVQPPPSSYEELFEYGRMAAEQLPAGVIVDEFLMGDAFFVSRSVIEKIGTLDPIYHGYFADPDFGIRAQIAGFQIILVQRAFAYHQQSANFTYLPDEQRNAKLRQRWERIGKCWDMFKSRHGIPEHLPYTSMSDIPWQEITSVKFDHRKHYFTPFDCSDALQR